MAYAVMGLKSWAHHWFPTPIPVASETYYFSFTTFSLFARAKFNKKSPQKNPTFVNPSSLWKMRRIIDVIGWGWWSEIGGYLEKPQNVCSWEHWQILNAARCFARIILRPPAAVKTGTKGIFITPSLQVSIDLTGKMIHAPHPLPPSLKTVTSLNKEARLLRFHFS